MAKTIVFCENNDHAHRVRMALNNFNLDLVAQYPNYVVRITDDDGPHGRALLDDFRMQNTTEPVIAVTSRLLTTGVDMPSVRNIVIFRRIASMPEFKQTIGRGTRLCLEVGKGSFDILDFVEATVLFNAPGFDGPPLRIQHDETDGQGNLIDTEEESSPVDEVDDEIAEPEPEYQEQDGGSFDGDEGSDDVVDDVGQVELIRARGRRFYVDGVDVYKWGEAFYQLESDGRTMRLITYRQFARNRVLELNLSPGDLRAQWAAATSRRALMEALASSGLEVDGLAERLQSPDVDPVDLLLNVSWGLPLVSREERAVRVRREHRAFFDSFAPEAQRVPRQVRGAWLHRAHHQDPASRTAEHDG
ncbi:MAG: helicase-related protein [Pseudonocardiaceae bacterium]